MIRKVFWVLVLANAALFAYLQWGGLLMQGGGSLEPALNPEKIKLLGFSPSASSAPSAASAPASVSTPPEAKQAPAAAQSSAACYEWGEFSGSDLASAKQDLAGLKLGDALSRREVVHSIGYWVYIPPAKRAATINARVAALKKHGIKDFFVVKDKGKWHGAISLNVFKTKGLAQKFKRHLEKKGVKGTVIGERQTRLKFTVFTLRDPAPATLAKLKEWQQGFTGISVKSATCK